MRERKIFEAIKNCKSCELHKTAKNKVIGRGSLSPDVLFVGEAPGAEEDIQGKPFAGPSGELLNHWIKKLKTKKVAIINIIKCRPPKNRTPTKEEVEECSKFLEAQIELLDPKIIVALGTVAMKELLGFDTGILKKSGKIETSYKYFNKPVFIMPHPAYFLRQGGKGWEDDIKSLKEEINKKHHFQPFVPLHVHSHFSIKDGSSKCSELFKEAKKQGYTALGISDHGTVAGWVDFAMAAKQYEIKPIFGIEFYVGNSHKPKDKNREHICAFAKNQKGIENIIKLVNISNDNEHFYYKPRIFLEDLMQYKEGLVITSACVLGVISQKIIEGDYPEAKKIAEMLKKEFKNDFYLEYQIHNFDKQEKVNLAIKSLSEELNIPTIVTTDVHYTNKSFKELHNSLKAIAYHKKYGEANFTGDSHCILSIKEMAEYAENVGLNYQEVMKAAKNTLEIAEKCNGKYESFGLIIPKFDATKYSQQIK